MLTFLHVHGLISKRSIFYWQDQPDDDHIQKKKFFFLCQGQQSLGWWGCRKVSFSHNVSNPNLFFSFPLFFFFSLWRRRKDKWEGGEKKWILLSLKNTILFSDMACLFCFTRWIFHNFCIAFRRNHSSYSFVKRTHTDKTRFKMEKKKRRHF